MRIGLTERMYGWRVQRFGGWFPKTVGKNGKTLMSGYDPIRIKLKKQPSRIQPFPMLQLGKYTSEALASRDRNNRNQPRLADSIFLDIR
jgi:hypothetical protein